MFSNSEIYIYTLTGATRQPAFHKFVAAVGDSSGFLGQAVQLPTKKNAGLSDKINFWELGRSWS
jgi:hypothetical protein